MTNHHYRTNYERMYHRLCKECELPMVLVDSWSDYKLLSKTNLLLSKLGLVTFEQEELEIDLI